MMLPKLFACMMLKDEAHNIHRCLKSIRKLCDEIVIVDTGSTDDTVKIARGYGAIVYPGAFNWRKPPIFDFSLHRNSGLQYCEELGADWVFVIDGDEELQPMKVSPEGFKRNLTKIKKSVHALGCQIHEPKNGKPLLSWLGTRFFKVRKGVFYDGICHNRPKLINGMAAHTDVVIHHYGYSDPNVMVAKRNRTLALLDKRIRDNPDDHEAYYYKAMTLFGLGRYDEGIEAAEMCFKTLSPKIDDDYNRMAYFGTLYFSTGWAWMKKWQETGDQESATRAYQWWIAGYEKWPDDLDINFCLCNLGYLGKQADLVKYHGDAYLRAVNRFVDELHYDPGDFESGVNMDDLIVGKRCLHMATEFHVNAIKAMMQEMEKKAA